MQSKTEEINNKSLNIDTKDTLEILKIINNEDKIVPFAIEKVLSTIAILIDDITPRFNNGGRIIYIGSGTSGRLGVLDASECPPTFSTESWQVVGIIAGGDYALRNAIEGAEDDESQGGIDLQNINLQSKDVVIGIAASGNTPYVYGALQFAQSLSCITGAISSNNNARIFEIATHKILTDSGAEIISGSTRLKAGTAQKLVLNMITTCTMIKLGKIYGNLMVDLKATNNKLIFRAKNLIKNILECDDVMAEKLFVDSGKSVKIAIIMGSLNISKSDSMHLLQKSNGLLSKILDTKQGE